MLELFGILACISACIIVAVHGLREDHINRTAARLDVDRIYRRRPVSNFYDQEAHDGR